MNKTKESREAALTAAIREGRLMDAVLGVDFLAKMLTCRDGIMGIASRLPPDVIVVSLLTDWSRNCVIARLASPSFHKTIPGACVPVIEDGLDMVSIRKLWVKADE